MERPPIWLASGLRTPFARVDGPLADRDALALSVPLAQAMARQVSGRKSRRGIAATGAMRSPSRKMSTAATSYPAEVEKLFLMDAFLPGVGDWETIDNSPAIWHFRFNGPTPEALVQGRERIYFEHFWNDFAADKTRSIPEADRRAYTEAYSRPGRMRAGSKGTTEALMKFL